MYRVSVKRPDGSIFIYERFIDNREEAEYAACEIMLEVDSKHSVFIEHELDAEFIDNIQES